MEKILFKKTNSEKIKIGTFLIGNLTNKCFVGKITLIENDNLLIEIYDSFGNVDDVISRNISKLGKSFFVAEKIILPHDDYYVIENDYDNI